MTSTIEAPASQPQPDQAARADWLGILSRARPDEVERLAGADVAGIHFDWLRPPHVGLVMVRGRAGGTGRRFNLGEMTLTRCSIKLADGTVGHGYASGRNLRHAEIAALLDACLQDEQRRPALLSRIIEPLKASEDARRLIASRKAASTKVEFFTMTRGDNHA